MHKPPFADFHFVPAVLTSSVWILLMCTETLRVDFPMKNRTEKLAIAIIGGRNGRMFPDREEIDVPKMETAWKEVRNVKTKILYRSFDLRRGALPGTVPCKKLREPRFRIRGKRVQKHGEVDSRRLHPSVE
jgi:hypothetical protein